MIEHLAAYLEAGHPLRVDGDVHSLVKAGLDDQERVFKGFDELGTQRLRPVFDRLEGRVSFDDLSVLRLIHLSHERGDAHGVRQPE